MSLRVRVFAALVVALVGGAFVLPWAVVQARNLWRVVLYDSRILVCTGDWRDWGDTYCNPDTFSVAGTVTRLVVVGLLVLAAVALLVLWSGRPLRSLATTVTRFGPQNLAERTEVRGRRSQYTRLAGQVDQMLDRVSAGYEGQRRFAANASHELRTPLAIQRTLIEVGMVGTPSPEQLELLTRQLLDTNERNEALVEGLLVLAETDRGLSSRTPQRLDAVVADTLATHASLATAAGVRVHAEVAPVEVPGESALLERLVANLVHNGIKYNDRDGDLWVTVGPGHPVLRVVNTGPEVAPESVPRLFEAFRRARGDRLDHSGGAGLGLTIARSIVQAHDGSVTATARPGGGLDVAVELPTGGPAT
ncbi:Signal transduction histidine kinase [Klenkia soli]|uniref:histidine kinase n=1 Tax=Klenkia soli TaxID=1052260 RepID=A0A1H0N5V2_9ACTN|nr:HAMP domain-containing sensor histidine kinase [Klenkia soli]SDO88042.1 Signal transduction histidine kinase [Klenkia soli]